MTVAQLLNRASSYELEEWKIADRLDYEDAERERAKHR